MDFSSLSEVEIWGLVKSGNQQAFSYIYSTFSKDLYKYGHKFTQDTNLIEDVIQDLFVHIWDLKKNINVKNSIKFYLFACFRRELIKKIKCAYKNESLEEVHSKFKWEASFLEILDENQIILESSNKISQALGQIPLRQKEAIYLRYIQELSYDEISKMMDVQVPSVYNLIFKGLKKLKNILSFTRTSTKFSGLLFLFFQ
ncbi:RNA polymerase sigma factor [Cyclobacterium qasimii]|uniref:RNA polymerase ECF-type sigma factor n=2 Tax=Cyclobacterium qasimii TaxID=1350429 RepID=S7VCF6_9BACT|nr:sigma-70 family RNA polymerase sigma factor [Cyclobacterium qasimii]EPR67661.1 RNA polymerase ECF-type sigma factor [Cyclobacterium qasimii M12-11B]GEO19492.1 DNA-directed RNA polymerase sigma-70 factor [Cyclobacterium qasimii]